MLGAPLGRGGAGAVFACHHRDDPSRIGALKFFDGVHDPGGAARTVREAQLLRRLDHPGIVRLIDVHQRAETSFLVMERVEGIALSALVAQGPRPAAAPPLGLSLALALQHAHRHGVVHRDIKPANCMVRRDGSVVLVDFGIARDRRSADLTPAGQRPPATLRYAPPEWLDGAESGVGWDLYGLGLVLAEIVTGAEVFAAPFVHAIELMRHKVATGPIALGAAVSPAFAALVAGLTHPDRHRRTTELDHVIACLRTECSRLDAAAGLHGVDWTPPRPRPTRRGVALSDVVDRDGLAADCSALLQAGRWVTLIGPPGVGKSTLAGLVVDRTAGDVVWCSIAPVGSREGVLRVVARALGVVLGGDEPERQLADALGADGGDRLLVLDQAEHVAHQLAELVAGWVDGAPRLTVLVTSQRPLGCAPNSCSPCRRFARTPR